MNTKAFKRLIKEAVIDAIHEELPYILEEHMAKQEKKALRENRTMSFTSEDVLPVSAKASLHSKMGAMFGYETPQAQTSLKVADAAANMTPMDRSGLRNLG